MVAGENLLVLRYPVQGALQAWPAETQKQLGAASLHQYLWIFDRSGKASWRGRVGGY